MKEVLLRIAAMLYGLVVGIRNFLFDIRVLKRTSFDIPVICVGNITVGGTGKTPMVELLVSRLSKQYRVAVVSRGYRRATKGYRIVHAEDKYRDVGDEPLQIKKKFPHVVVAVGENRVKCIKQLRTDFPDVNLVIMDDGFQHRYVDPYINIIMLDFTRPVESDHLLPLGQLRDRPSTLRRANYFVMTKCDESTYVSQFRVMRRSIAVKSSQRVYFTSVDNSSIEPVFEGVRRGIPLHSEVIAMSGIGNNDVFFRNMQERFNIVEKLEFEDHHTYKVGDIKLLKKYLDSHPMAVIITTEKDAVKLCHSSRIPKEIKERAFYQKIGMKFVSYEDNSEDIFMNQIETDLRQMNSGNYIRGINA